MDACTNRRLAGAMSEGHVLTRDPKRMLTRGYEVEWLRGLLRAIARATGTATQPKESNERVRDETQNQ